MRMKRASKLTFAATVLFATGYSQVAIASPEGFWGGGYRSNSGAQIQFSVQVIEGLGEIKTKISKWNDLGFGNCNYYFQVEGDGFQKTYLNSAESLETCPNDLQLKLSQNQPNTLFLQFSNDSLVPQAEITAGLRPIADEDRRTKVDELDVLGVRLGMTQQEAAEILGKVGYEEARELEGLRTGDTYQLRTAVFGRNKADGEYRDVVAIALVSEPLGQRTNGLVKGISRDWTISPEEELASATLKTALTKKYGPSPSGDYRFYDRAGNRSDGRNFCSDGPLQELQYGIDGPYRAYGTTSPHCGPKLEISVSDDRRTGKATRLRLHVADPDLVWYDFWETWSVSERQRMQTIFSSVSGATAAAPEL